MLPDVLCILVTFLQHMQTMQGITRLETVQGSSAVQLYPGIVI